MELEQINGVGSTTIRDLNNLGINNINDLVSYYPFRYDILEKTGSDMFEDGKRVVISGMCENRPNVHYISRRLNKMSFRINNGENIFNVTIFNRAYLKSYIDIGTKLTVVGRYDKRYNTINANKIIMGLLDEVIIEPIYHSSNKVNSKKINKIINDALTWYDVIDYIPDYLNEKYNFGDKKTSVFTVHNPKQVDILNKALDKLKYEELFIFMLRINLLKECNHEGLTRNVIYDDVLELINTLPFTLTEDQMNSVQDIYHDLVSSKRMNRLLQGDVGSGKTIVSFIALYINYLSGYQGALMAPTEILAIQHFNNIQKLFPNLNIAILTGKSKAKERREILYGLSNGDIDIIIGTHALISDNVIYGNLGLVVTDEQHRFGVNQRSNLNNKGIRPDILYMSATPIPRTYALTLYGDMDISSIRTMPSGRKPVETILRTNKEIKEVLYMMLDEIRKKHQIYVVAPLVEDSETSDMENVYALEEKMNKAFGKVAKIGVLHGKMKNDLKDQVMDEFKRNEIQILISTTVIEVGVDVPNATMMVIFDSYRFGLSALHQLRGRVGRNSLESYCILISDNETARLKILTETNDGFKVSEEDFKLRGSGDLFGVRQSGDMQFKLADIKKDYDLMVKIKKDCEEFISSGKYHDRVYPHINEFIESMENLD